jgi:hypothetical protein
MNLGNYPGIPTPGLTWNQVSCLPLPTKPVLQYCPECGKPLYTYKSDYREELKQHMVIGEYCADGHYTSLEWA